MPLRSRPHRAARTPARCGAAVAVATSVVAVAPGAGPDVEVVTPDGEKPFTVAAAGASAGAAFDAP